MHYSRLRQAIRSKFFQPGFSQAGQHRAAHRAAPSALGRSSTILLLALALACLGGQPARANTPLTKAVISSLRNRVRLLPQNRPTRSAKLSDVLTPGDALVTSRQSLAELRFNDGSLARMGEQAMFRFVPKTRSFRLSNGTVLMLIPPGQGSTRVRTPNVTAGIRGSALIVRYDQATDKTTVIALTNSDISASNLDGSQSKVLRAGQGVGFVGSDLVEFFDVDLDELYRSPILKDLEMDRPNSTVGDEAIAQVRQETLEGLQSQASFQPGEGRDVTEQLRLSNVDIDALVANETGRPFGHALPEQPPGLGLIEEVRTGRFPAAELGGEAKLPNRDANSTDSFADGSPIAQPGLVPQPLVNQPPDQLGGPVGAPQGEVEANLPALTLLGRMPLMAVACWDCPSLPPPGPRAQSVR
ncbi:MAG: FecR domain-containing protein [Synechococcales cyanobacterium RM1_1_8]|nr:FecR domain-containing protein [Synechococcales cyanobacterium RM1_1_8]